MRLRSPKSMVSAGICRIRYPRYGDGKMKEEIKGNILNPLPVALVGALVNGKPNYLVIGYISPFNFGKHVFFSLFKKRYTRIGIHEHMTFSVNIPSISLLEETQLCGSKSGRDLDKSSLFDSFFGDLKTAPMIRECPLNMECEVEQIIDYDLNEGIIGKVVKSYANSNTVYDGKLDIRKVQPIIWATCGDFNYYNIGSRMSA
ncbi:MAG: flavin reductase family protein [Candidatus Thorarchaeota archaeon]